MKCFEQAGACRHKIVSLVLTTVLVVLILGLAAPRSMAQNDGSIAGTILDITAKPWADLTIQIVSDQGSKAETKTDKDGNFLFRNLKTGEYHVDIIFPPPNQGVPYDVHIRVLGGAATRVDMNFKEIVAKQGGPSAEQVQKQEEQKKAAASMKTHFDAGQALLDQEHAAKAELLKASADQKDAAKQKVVDLSNQAAAEFQGAQKAAGEKDPNTALFWAKLGDVYDTAGRE